MKNIFLFMFLMLGVNLSAQNCNDDAHSINFNDGWLSCEKTQNPNPKRGNTHWVLYDLGHNYNIGTTKFWNFNVAGETDWGMKDIKIDFSINGINWTQAASFQLSEASGTPDYEGEDGPDLGNILARYILLSSKRSWGGAACAGLAEVRFNVDDIVFIRETTEFLAQSELTLFPNPASDRILLDTDLEFQEIVVLNASGHEVLRKAAGKMLDISSLPSGLYFLKLIDEVNRVLIRRFVKQTP